MTTKNDKKDIELANKGGDDDDDKVEKPDEDEEESSDEDLLDQDFDVPMFVFLWTYKPWHIFSHFVPFFLTHTCMFCAFGVLLCNYGYAGQVCTWIGLCGFVSCILGMSKIQTFSRVMGESEKLKEELTKMKKLMQKFQDENDILKETLVKLEEQSEALKEESSKLSRFNKELNINTDEYEKHVRDFRRERLDLAETFEHIDDIVKTLSHKEVDMQKRCTILKKELKKLRAHNKAILETYKLLAEEHKTVRKTNDVMAQQIKKFQEMRLTFIDQRDVLRRSMYGNLTGLNSTIDTYEILYLQEIAHNTEFLDGSPGMTWAKFEEFIRRIPANINVSRDKLEELFDLLMDENEVCDHEAMRTIVVEIVKKNANMPSRLDDDKKVPTKP